MKTHKISTIECRTKELVTKKKERQNINEVSYSFVSNHKAFVAQLMLTKLLNYAVHF